MFLRLSLLLFIFTTPFFSPFVHATPEERKVLISLYHAIDGDNWVYKDGWLGQEGTECNWLGITCSDDGHIIKLSLNGKRIKAEFPSILADLTHLEHLSLAGNHFQGSFPIDILSNLISLKHLDFSGNNLTGDIPAGINKLSNLTFLRLRGNKLTGSIPVELTQLNQLKRLDLGSNLLSGSIPKQLSQLSQLERLDLSGNLLSGSIPVELSSLTHLTGLNFSANLLTGIIPKEFSLLTELKTLKFFDNQMSGSLPLELGVLTNLVALHFGQNQFTGMIPTEYKQLTKVKSITFEGNKLTGTITDEFDVFREAFNLSLDNNCFDLGSYDFVTTLNTVKNLDIGDQNACQSNAESLPIVKMVGVRRIEIPLVVVNGKAYQLTLKDLSDRRIEHSFQHWRVEADSIKLIDNSIEKPKNPAVEFDTETSILTFNQIRFRDQIISGTLYPGTPPINTEGGIYFKYIPLD